MSETPHPLVTYRAKQSPPLTRSALADQLGVSRETVWRWENRRQGIDRQLWAKVSRVTGIAIPELIELGDEAA